MNQPWLLNHYLNDTVPVPWLQQGYSTLMGIAGSLVKVLINCHYTHAVYSWSVLASLLSSPFSSQNLISSGLKALISLVKQT